jgi:magnesium-transporting ATPase (P-type)
MGLSEGSAIFIIVIFIFVAKYYIQFDQERRLRTVAEKANITIVPVYRDSKSVQNIKSTELVVGDLIQVR